MEQRLKYLEMAARLNGTNADLDVLFETARRLWEWGAELPPEKSKTTRNVERSLARLRASQGAETL
jgi:hypothetical protein